MRLNHAVSPVTGFADVVGSQLIRSERAVQRARQALSLRGYVPIETPLLEHSELFLRRSGGVLSSQMYAFNSPDGADVSIRPEMTAPVIRHALEDDEVPYPRRLQYASPVIRYPEHSSVFATDIPDGNRQFTQVGAELIGHSGPESDGEVIAAACEAATAIGIDDVRVVLGHAGITRVLLEQLRLPRGARQFLALNLERLKDEDSVEEIVSEAEGLLFRSQSGIESLRARHIESLTAIKLAEAASSGETNRTMGRRDVESVGARIRDLVADDGSNIDLVRPFRFISALASIAGSPESALDDLAKLCEGYNPTGLQIIDPRPEIQQVRNTVDSAINEGVDPIKVTVDYGMPVGMAYYTGMVFELRADVGPHADMKLGSGGRYDSLAYALGSREDIPALGFALNLDEILAAAPDYGNEQVGVGQTVVVGAPDAGQPVVSSVARMLRHGSEPVIVCYGDIEEAKALAQSIGRDSINVVATDGSIETVPV